MRRWTSTHAAIRGAAGRTFHHDLALIRQAQPDHRGQVAGPEQLHRGSTAEMIRAPRREAGSLDGRYTR